MKKGYLALLVGAFIVLTFFAWKNLNETPRVALAPETSATKTERASGVLGFVDIPKKPLGTVQEVDGYTVVIKDRRILSLEVCNDTTKDSGTCVSKKTQPIVEYTLVFDVSKLNMGDEELANFLSSKLGKGYVFGVGVDGEVIVSQNLGGFPQQTVRFVVDSPDDQMVIRYQSQAMKDAGKQPISWSYK